MKAWFFWYNFVILMNNIMNMLSRAKVYVVLDRAIADYRKLFDVLKFCVDAGADIVQLRDKNGSAKEIFSFVRDALYLTRGKLLFIVNDRLDIALAAGCDGVHLGQDDLPVAEARRIAGAGLVIGTSCQTIEHLYQAEAAGADYVGFGSVFKTLTKPQRSPMPLEVLKSAGAQSHIPVFPIGGITLDNIDQVTALGINRVAVTRAVCLSDDAGSVIRSFRSKLSNRMTNDQECS